ncbi:MAG: adenylate/guanylate cyclase domain-containing protein [Lachnospiraceae bacterium]
MKKMKLKQLWFPLLAAALFALLPLTGVLYTADHILGDMLYQKPQALSGNIILLGIDNAALEEIGPFQTWGRDVIAQVIQELNAEEENKPAAIGVDVIYSGETTPAEDAYLAQTAKDGGNVLVAAAASFGEAVITNQEGFYLDTNAILDFDEPYDALKAATRQGHINAMNDRDGILRHCILKLDLPQGGEVFSFNYGLAQMYAEKTGQTLVPPPTDALHRWYLSFSALPGDFSDGYSVADVLNGSLPPELFKDKIVLIGPYAAGLTDIVTAAIDHAAPMYGIEYQANAIDALLEGDFKREVSNVGQALVLFLILFCYAWWLRDRKALQASISLAVILLLSFTGCLLAWQMGFVLKPLYLPMAAIILYVISVAVNYVRAVLEKRRVTGTFQRYVAPEIVSEILKEGSQSLGLGGKLTDIAVLFVDIRGFTTMSELLEPAMVVEILNRYLTLTSSCILQNGGTLDKFVGDCTMAFWGAPLPQEDVIFKAVKTALDMVEGSKALSEELQEKFGRSVSFGIGVHYGSAIIGNIGAPNRMDYTAIGDTVNTASRLESNAPGGQILVSRVVADALADRVKFTSLGDSIKLKGKAEGFEILRVEGLQSK